MTSNNELPTNDKDHLPFGSAEADEKTKLNTYNDIYNKLVNMNPLPQFQLTKKQLHLPFKYSVEAKGKNEFKKCTECGTDEMHEGPDGKIIEGCLYCFDCYSNYLYKNGVDTDNMDEFNQFEQKQNVDFLMSLIYEFAAKNEKLEERISELEKRISKLDNL